MCSHVIDLVFLTSVDHGGPLCQNKETGHLPGRREPEVLNIVPNTTFRSYAPQGVPWMVQRTPRIFLPEVGKQAIATKHDDLTAHRKDDFHRC